MKFPTDKKHNAAKAADALLASAPRFNVSSHVSSRVMTTGLGRLNNIEMMSVYALLAYVAHNENARQETVQSMVEASFNVNHVSKLRQRDYESVIRFLVDLHLDDMRH